MVLYSLLDYLWRSALLSQVRELRGGVYDNNVVNAGYEFRREVSETIEMIRRTEEAVSKQVVETSDILNVHNGAINNMVDVRACNKPVERVSLMHLLVKCVNFVV